MDQAFVPEKTSKLVIRVKMDTASNPSASTDIESDSEFNPVALAILAIALLLIAGAGYFYFSGSNEIDIPAEFEAQNTVTEISEQPILTAPSIEKREVDKVLPMVETQSKITEIETPVSIANVEVSEPTARAEVFETIVKEIPEEPVVAEALVIAENIVVDTVLEESVEVETIIEKDPEPVIAAVVDFSVNVSRAQFTNDINNREPTDLVEGIVPAKTEGLRRVYFFSELMNLKGQAIRHQWLHEGKLKSELKFKVGGNRWRVNSSKRLNPAAMGNWQVQVVNEAGDILISKGFEYKLL